MGYDLHITRADDWTRSEVVPITVDEWLDAVATDPDLRIDPRNGPYFAVWGNATENRAESWLDWSDGEVFTKNPRRIELAKMLDLAARFGASVQGDDGERYACVDDLPEDDAFARTLRPWWKFW